MGCDPCIAGATWAGQEKIWALVVLTVGLVLAGCGSVGRRRGMRAFFGHVVTYDFPARKLYLKRACDADVPSSVELRLKGLGLALRRRHGALFVSAAGGDGVGYREGVRRNDTLLAVDGQDVSTYSLAALVRILSELHKGPDGIVIFTFKRGEAKVDVSVGKSDLAPKNDGSD